MRELWWTGFPRLWVGWKAEAQDYSKKKQIMLTIHCAKNASGRLWPGWCGLWLQERTETRIFILPLGIKGFEKGYYFLLNENITDIPGTH